ncbi:hypothetical protein M5Z74_09040, partial [Neisseria meningitidis]|nr:hypothetical protein [Neisseria meningitidis]MCL5717640.1 hypothetical protein [Neisseria meningitidis]
VVSFALGQLRVAHGNLSCRKGRMLPHTGLFLLGKVALQMRIRQGVLKWVRGNFREWGSGIQAKKSYDGIVCRNGPPMPSEAFRRHFV